MEASLIVKRLPNIQYSNEAFDKLIFNKCQNATSVSVLATIAIFCLAAFLLYSGITAKFPLFIGMGLVGVVTGIYCIKYFSGELRGGQYWIDLIKTHPEKIVWIKPIVTKHTVGYIITLYKERKFQLLTKGGLKITMKCDTEEERQLFFEGIKNYLPHAHIGYSPDIAALYSSGSAKFIGSLQSRRLYTPIDVFNI
jgi:hypothetical protein